MAHYEELATKLRFAIERGDYAPGTTLPKQVEIAEAEKVGVKTVRAAVNLLAAEGLVTPVRRRGTVVQAQPERIRMGMDRYDRRGWKQLRKFDPCVDLGAYTMGDFSSVPEGTFDAVISGDDPGTAEPRTADRATARALDIAPGDAVEVQRFLLWDQPHTPTRTLTAVTPSGLLATAERPVSYVSGPAVFLGTLAAYEAAGFIIGAVAETLSVRSPTPDERKTLRVPHGESIVEVRRRTDQASGRPMEYAMYVCRAPYFEWTYRFEPWDSPSSAAPFPLDGLRKAL